MHSTWATTLFIVLTLVSLGLLIKSVAKLIAIYSIEPCTKQSAQSAAFDFDIKAPGVYEIAVKRPSILGLIPKNNSFRIRDLQTGETIVVGTYIFSSSKRTDIAGHRTVSVGEFTIKYPGSFRLENFSTSTFKENDQLLIGPKPVGGVLMILATVFSGVFFIVGLVFSILSLVNTAT
ncbi:hypothetical protein ACFSUS_09175 [Spirosoma soli]|uniref:DUF3592 domain-containing protein n=1 Tax=Spirosoma soli TaxID=1770529 RepID=A0ABW5M524_9BACT